MKLAGYALALFLWSAGQAAAQPAPASECEVFALERSAFYGPNASDLYASILEQARGQQVVGVQCTFVEVADVRQIAIRDNARGENARVPIIHAERTGGLEPGRPELAGFTLYAPLSLHSGWGFGRRARAYTILLPDGRTIALEEKHWQDEAKRFGNVGISAALLDGDDDNLGLQFEGRWVLDQNLAFLGQDNLAVSINAAGEIASDEDVETFSRTFTADITISKFVRLTRASGAQMNFVPLAIESDQDLDVVIGRTTIGAVARVPGSQQLAANIGRALGCDEVEDAEVSNCVNGGMFVEIDAGARYDLRRPDGEEKKTSSTWGARVFYNFPLSTNWDFTLNASHRDDGGETASSHELSLRYFVNCPRRAAFTISYIDGEFAPLSENIEGLRLGFTALLGNVGAAASNPSGACPAD